MCVGTRQDQGWDGFRVLQGHGGARDHEAAGSAGHLDRLVALKEGVVYGGHQKAGSFAVCRLARGDRDRRDRSRGVVGRQRGAAAQRERYLGRRSSRLGKASGNCDGRRSVIFRDLIRRRGERDCRRASALPGQSLRFIIIR